MAIKATRRETVLSVLWGLVITLGKRMAQITEMQHFVPQFYLRQWSDATGRVYWHNLRFRKCRPGGTRSRLQQSFFYEDDAANPDNRVENMLSQMEDDCAPTFRKVWDLAQGLQRIREKKIALSHMRSQIGEGDVESIKRFAALQYIRTPGAVRTKAAELVNSKIPDHVKRIALRPGVFTENGYNYKTDFSS